MAIFMLDCDSVTSTASSINSLVTQFSQLSDSVNGYDTSCEDGFDFAGGKAAIAANIEACTTKVQNTVKLIEGVVSSHTTLQNTFTLDQNGAVGSETQNRETSATTGTIGTAGTSGSTDTTGSSGGSYSGGGYSGGGYSGGGYSGGGYSGGGYSGGGYSGGGYAGAGVAGGIAGGLASTGASAEKPVDITSKINSVDQVTVDVDKLDAANKTKFITGMTYNELGYATFEDKYVIVCDTTLANIGDNLVFTNTDGTKIDCVVGAVVDYSQEYKGNVSFIVNNNWNAQGANNLTFDLKTMKITNNGQYVPKKV